MRVLLGPVNTANQAALQAKALRALGHEAEAWHFGPTRYGYVPDSARDWPNTPSEALALVSEIVDRNFDVIHLHGARSLIPPDNPLGEFWDLPIWNQLGKRVVMSFHGTEIRDIELEKALDRWSYYHSGAPHESAARVESRLATLRLLVGAMTVSAGANFDHVPDANHLPLVVDTDAIREGRPPTREVPVIAHAPSLRSTKGTEAILEAFATLRAEGVAFDVDLIEDVDNATAIARMSAADIVVEKVLGDGYGVTALEGLASGRPVVGRTTARATFKVPGYPGVSADPDSIVSVLRALIQSPERRADLGKRGREFVLATHSPAVVGAALERLYAGVDVIAPNESATASAEAILAEVVALRAKNRELEKSRTEALNQAKREARSRKEVQATFGYRAHRRLLRFARGGRGESGSRNVSQ